MVDRIEVFVDTSYLLASFYNSWTTGARAQLEIDLPAVTSRLNTFVSDKIHLPVHRQLWYDGIPDSGPHRYQRTLRHIDGVQLRAGQLIEWGDRRTQKGVDTRLVADIVLRSIRGIVSDIVLVSGDADMIPGVEIAVEHGVRVHLIGFGWDSISNSLRSACDTVTVLDPRDDFDECMHIEVLEPFSLQEDDGDGDSTAPAELKTAALLDTDDVPEIDAVEEAEGNGTTDGFDIATDVPHGVPLVPPILTPGKLGRRSTRHRIRTNHAISDCTAHDAELEAEASAGQEKGTSPSQQDTAGNAPHADVSAGSPGTAKVATQTTAQGHGLAGMSLAEAEADATATQPQESQTGSPVTDETPVDTDTTPDLPVDAELVSQPTRRPSPGMMAQKRRPTQRSRYVPLPYDEVWESSGNQTPFDVGQQYAMWWYNNAATAEQRSTAHILTGGGLPAEIDRPLLQFACQTLDAYTLSDSQRVNLRDGFHMGIRGIIMDR